MPRQEIVQKVQLWVFGVVLGTLALWQLSSAAAGRCEAAESSVPGFLQGTSITGGLIVLLGCDDVSELTQAARTDRYLIQVLVPGSAQVESLRQQLRGGQVYGRVSVSQVDGAALPYASNLVNLVVVQGDTQVARDEILRVLAPGGVARFRQGDDWNDMRKPRPAEIDQWTHYMYDASGNPVAHDEVVGPPGAIQWIAGPNYTRGHEYTPSISSLVSASGRIFYIADEAAIDDVGKPSQWTLVARDAFNGLLLWQCPLESWFPHLINWGSAPRELQRKLVAIDDRVYVSLGLHSPLCEVDAASGQVLRTFENTRGTEEIIYHQGILLLVVREVTDARVDELRKWGELIQQRDKVLATRDTAAPLISRLRAIENRAPQRIVAIDASSGKMIWKIDGPLSERFRSVTLCASGDQVFYQNGGEVVSVSLSDGSLLWDQSSEPLRVVSQNRIICADGKQVSAMAAEDGRVLWRQDLLLTEVRDVFVAAGSVWVGGFKPIEGKRGPSWGPYFVTQRDLNTGEVLMHIEPENPEHHHRCYQNKATDRYILGGRRGTEFIDLATGDVLWNSWVRGVCKYGVMPCNGLLYAPPHACACYMTVKTIGFHAFGPRGPRIAGSDQRQLVRGPAFAAVALGGEQKDAWPTYRGNAQRSGSTPQKLAARLQQRWQIAVGGRLTSPTVADGRVYLSSIDEHRLTAFAADNGAPVWSFSADARIDTPPTLWRGRALFGSQDGSIYSLRANDGVLDWRLDPRHHQMIVVRGQLESTAPVAGSVLVAGEHLFATSGRSSYADDGLTLWKVEPVTGEVVAQTEIYSPDPLTGKQPDQYGPNAMPGACAYVLSADDQFVYLRDLVYGHDTVPQASGNDHLLTLTGFRDDSGTHRSFWVFGQHVSISSGCSSRDKNIIAGRLLAFDNSHVYGFGRTRVHWSSQLEDGPYRLFAVPRGGSETTWSLPVPLTVRSMLLADEILFVAGQRDEPQMPMAEGRGVLMAIATEDGKVLGECPIDGLPVFDALAAADGCLFLTLENGQLVCFEAVDL